MEIVDALTHYERLVDEGNDPFRDPAPAQRYMARWDGPLFFRALGPVQGRRVLEVGVGTGRLARQVLDAGCAHLTGIDLSPKTIARARENLVAYANAELLVADAQSFMRAQWFDAAYSVLTFFHIRDKQGALANMVASLRAGGRLALSLSDEGEWCECGARKVPLYWEPPERYAAWLTDSGCMVDPLLDLVDRQGRKVATVVAATKL